MSTILDLLVGLGIDSDSYEKGIDSADAKADNFVGKITGTLGPAIAGAFAAGGAAVVGFAATSVAQFSTFQASMNEVFTLLPGISQDAMNGMTDQVKDFSKEFGVLPDKVVPALYQSLSAGVPPDNVFAFLEAANKASTAGVTDLSVAVDGISSVVNAYGSDVIDATKASDLMFTAVKLGKTNFEQLSSSLFNVTPTAAAANVKFNEITASLAAMTLQGVPTSVATTQLRSALVELSKDGTKVSDLFEKLSGKSFKEFEASGGNVQQALQLLEGYAKDAGLGINDLFGSVEAGNAALALTGKGTDAFSNALAGMAGSAGATDAAFATMNTGIADAIDDIRAIFAVFMLDLGERLAPAVQLFVDTVGAKIPELTSIFFAFFDSLTIGLDNVTRVIEAGGIEALFTVFEDGTSAISAFLERFGVAPATALQVSNALQSVYTTLLPLMPLITQIGNLIADNWQPILAGVAGVLGVVIVSAIASAIAAIVSIAAPIIAAIAIGAALYKAYTENFLGIATVVNAVINGVQKVITAVMTIVLAFWKQNGEDIMQTADSAFNQVLDIVSGVMNIIGTVISSVLNFVANFWLNHKTLVVGYVTALWNVVSGLFQAGLDIIEGLVKIVTGIINGDWQTFADGCAQVVTGLFDALKTIVTDGLDLLFKSWQLTITAIDDLLGGFISRALELGGNIIQGVVDGVKNGASALSDAVTNAASDAFNAAKDFLGISSPSTLMYDKVGIDMMLGWIRAITDSKSMLNDAIASAGLSAVNVATDITTAPLNNAPYPAAASAAVGTSAASGVTQQFNIEAHYKTVQDEMTLRDRIRLEGMLNAPSAG